MKVLIVDDSLMMRKILSGALTKAGVKETIQATNGKEAVEILAKDTTIDLVLMDWNMPVMMGIDAVREIRAANNPVPIVMVSTETERDRVMEAINAGANDYLAKPFGAKDIIAKLSHFLKPTEHM